MESTKKKKIILVTIFAVLILIVGSFYFCDPLENFNHYDIPKDPDDIVLCYYRADSNVTNIKHYVITRNGMVKVYAPDHSVSYDEINEWNKTETDGVQIDPLTDEQIEYLEKINTDNSHIAIQTEIPICAKPEVDYEVIQKREGEYVRRAIKIIEYNGSLGNDPKVIEKCRSIHTNEICEYIDNAVSAVDGK